MWRTAPLFATLALVIVACGRDAGSSTSGTATPINWPISGLALPVGAQDAEFSPGPLREVTSRLPRRRRLGQVRTPPPPPQWNAFFAYNGEPAKVFEHFDSFFAAKKFEATEIRDLEVGTENEARSHNFLSPDKQHSVSIRYWKVSDKPGARPYQLLVRQSSVNSDRG